MKEEVLHANAGRFEPIAQLDEHIWDAAEAVAGNRRDDAILVF